MPVLERAQEKIGPCIARSRRVGHCRQSGAARRQYHRLYAVRVQFDREMARIAQGGRAGLEACGGAARCHDNARDRSVCRPLCEHAAAARTSSGIEVACRFSTSRSTQRVLPETATEQSGSQAMNSLRSRAGIVFLATMIRGSLDTSETGSKSFSRSYCSANMGPLRTCVAQLPRTSV
jgi:hypothetical protein